ncbi:MAG: tetratricopeptide repeat protein [Tepidisphaeraceae bacterium]
MNQRPRTTSFALWAAVLATAGGCASQPVGKTSGAATLPIEQQSLETMQPPLKLPAPAAQPSGNVPVAALQLYAQGRDALLRDDKSAAIDKFDAVLKLDPTAAVAYRDLGYACLGVDNVRALSAFQKAVDDDPMDADSRVQAARLLIDAKNFDAAIRELRLARLTPDYQDHDDLSALTDLLLGRLLEDRQYRQAALECYENVLRVVDAGSINLRGRPELAELVAKPAALVLRTADLAMLCGDHGRAIALYQRVEKQEPQAAAVLELRIARADLASGRTADATQRAFEVVDKFQAAPSVVVAFVDIFKDHGGPAEALKQMDALHVSPTQTNTWHSLRAQLLLMNDRAKDAIAEIDQASPVDLTIIRTTVHAYRAAHEDRALLAKLIERTTQQPERWQLIAHGWAMLTQLGQPHPVSISQIQAVEVPPGQLAAKQFVIAKLYASSGQPVASKRALQSAIKADARFVRTASTPTIPDATPDVDYATSTDLAGMLADLSDDPDFLAASVAAMLRDGQKQIVQESLQLANAQRPGNVVLASIYAQVLSGDQQNTEAVSVLDRAAAKAQSASELYYLSSQYSGMGDNKSSEQLLRRALEKDPDSAPVCNDLGFLLAEQGRDLDFAEKLLWKACGLEPDNPAYLDSLGWLLYKRSSFGQAVQYLQQAVSASDPVDPTVLDHAGDAAYRNKQTDMARYCWMRAVDAVKQRGSNDPQLRLRLEQKVRQLDAKQKVDVAPVAK